ncbi:hypothetical protein AALP_AA1G332300 [Arabis alpina]|uniref:Essential protein Yae1 N-terminal domain-containing protein n=1 Tax=Arabis alpina TaxID=50452 RepID=A0A087HSA5_ARAAL|nr:hypothetical protein AALP_AA1G332300 [Arabis alpina]
MTNIGESLELSDNGVDDYNLEDFDDSWDSRLSQIREMDRDSEKIREKFYMEGYRNGIFAGKDAGFEEGLNIGFKESVLDGYKFGIVRGVCSALAFLPRELREKLNDEEETREEFQKLHNSVHAISTASAVKLYFETMTIKQEECVEEGPSSGLGRYVSELSSLLDKSPKIEVSQHSKYLCTSVESNADRSIKRL